MTTHPDLAPLSSGILSVLPIFYVAWADGILSPSEMDAIRQQLNSYDFLHESDIRYLQKYTDPKHPPSPKLFEHWSQEITRHASELPPKERSSLAQLGRDIALNMSNKQEDSRWISHKTLQSIQYLESKLGVDNPESHKILVDLFHNKPKIWQSHASEFPTSALHQYLEGDNREMRDRLRSLLSDPAFAKSYNPDKEVYRQQILEQCKLLAQQGYGNYAQPEYTGGKDSMRDYASVFELLAHFDGSLAVKFGVQFGLYALSIQHLGSREQHDRWLRDAATMRTMGCFAMTEIGHGSNVRDIETTATLDPQADQWIIHSPTASATKEYIGNTLHADQAVVFAQLYIKDINHGVHAFVVPLRDTEGNDVQGLTRSDSGYKLGLNGVDNGQLSFDQVRIPRDHLLDKYGQVALNGQYSSPIANPSKRFFTMLGTLVGGRICVSHAALATAKNALTIAIRYGHRRRQFRSSDPGRETLLMDYPSHQQRLLPHLAKAYGYHFALETITKLYIDKGESSQKIESEAAGLKAKATWLAIDAIQEAREACGGAGYMRSSGIPRLRQDADIFATFEGDNTVLMQLVAKSLLSEFKQKFHDEGFSAVFRVLMRRASTAITEQNILQRRKTDAEHLLDLDFHREAFRFREKRMLFSLSQRMRNYLSMQISPYEAFLRCQNHMINLAHAHIDRYVLTSFHKAIHKAPEEITDTLRLLSEVYALTILHEERAFFLEHGYMEPRKTKAIRRLWHQRLSTLKSGSLALVDVWAIPDECLRSDIGNFGL